MDLTERQFDWTMRSVGIVLMVSVAIVSGGSTWAFCVHPELMAGGLMGVGLFVLSFPGHT